MMKSKTQNPSLKEANKVNRSLLEARSQHPCGHDKLIMNFQYFPVHLVYEFAVFFSNLCPSVLVFIYTGTIIFHTSIVM